MKIAPLSDTYPDLAPSNYFLFSNLEKWFGEGEFGSNDEVSSVKQTYHFITSTNLTRKVSINHRNVGQSV